MQFQFASPLLREYREWPSALIPPSREEGGSFIRASLLPSAKLLWGATALVVVTPLYSDLRVAYFPPWGCLLSGWGHHPAFHPENLILGDEVLNPGGPPFGRYEHHRLLPGFHARFHGPPNLNAGKPEALLELAWSGACLRNLEANALRPGFTLLPKEDDHEKEEAPHRLIPPPLRELASRLGDSNHAKNPALDAWKARAGFRERREGGWNVRPGWWVPALEWDWLEAPWKAAYLRDWYAESAALVWAIERADLPWSLAQEADLRRRRRAGGEWHPGPPPALSLGIEGGDYGGFFLSLGELYPRAHHSEGPDPDLDPQRLLWASANLQLRSTFLDPMTGPEPWESEGGLKRMRVLPNPFPRVEGLKARGGWQPDFAMEFSPSEWPRIYPSGDGPGRSLDSLFMHIRKDRAVPRSIKEHNRRWGPQDIWPPIWEGIAERELRGSQAPCREGSSEGEGGSLREVRRGEEPMYLSHEMLDLWE